MSGDSIDDSQTHPRNAPTGFAIAYPLRRSHAHRVAVVRSAIAIPVLILALWQVISSAEIIRPIFLPSPLEVLHALADSISDGSILIHISASCFRVFIGFLISFLIAVPLGATAAVSNQFRPYLERFNDFLRYIPVPAMVPLLILWLGITDACQIAVIIFGTLPQLLTMVIDAVTSIPSSYVDICAMHHLNRWRKLTCAYVPFASPQIYDAARVSIGWSWSYLLVAEIIGANHGLGQNIIVAQRFVRTDQVMAGILVVASLGLTVDSIFRAVYPFLFPWSERTRHLRG